MNKDRAHYNVRYCIDCGKELNYHEWYYGACSDCIKRRAKKRGWKPAQYAEGAGWFYADNAPRWHEYGDPKDMDNMGTALLVEVLRHNGAYFGQQPNFDKMQPASVYDEPFNNSPVNNKGRKQKAMPDGMKRCSHCGKLIPIAGPSRCKLCGDKYRERQRDKREKRKAEHCCTGCGAKLPRGWTHVKCPHCFEISNRRREE